MKIAHMLILRNHIFHMVTICRVGRSAVEVMIWTFAYICCEKLCVADTKACSLITRSQLTNYWVMPTATVWPKRHERHTQKFKSLHRRLSDLLGSTIKNADLDRRHTYSPPPPVPYIKKVAADTKARSLITRSQLGNYCVIPTLVSDQSGMSDLLKN